MIKDLITRVRSYAILIAMYEHGYDYISCFVPVVLQFVPEYDYANVTIIKHDLEEFIDLPELTVRKILNKAKNMNFIEVQEDEEGDELYKIKKEAQNKLIEQRMAVNKRINQMFNDIKRYFINKGLIPDQSIHSIVEAFIEKAGFNVNFLNPSRYSEQVEMPQIENSCVKLLSQYLQEPNLSLTHLNTFREFVMGSIISKALEWTDLNSINLKSFRKCELFLDTNIVFSLLELHDERINKPVKEMHERLIKRFNFKLKIFDFTLAQVYRVLRAYSPDNIIYTPDIQRPSVHNTFKKLGWSKNDVNIYIEELPEKLKELGITIYKTNLVLHEMRPPEDKQLADFVDLYRDIFIQYKPKSDEFGIQHDLAAFMSVRTIRGNIPVSINDPKSFFLTSDQRLTDLSQTHLTMNGKQSICEVVLDMSFASMLWCLEKEDGVTFSIDMIIAAYARNLFISKKVWERFMFVLNQISKKRIVEVEQIPNIFYKKIQNILNEFSDEQVDKVTEQFLIDQINISRKDSENLLVKFENLHSSIREKDDQITNMGNKIKELSKSCKLFENNILEYQKQKKILLSFIMLLLFIILFFIYFILRN